MQLTGVHLLLTYTCNFECDHCFVWGSPWQEGTMGLKHVDRILHQAADMPSVEWIYFEGGEPFLHYAVLVRSVQMAADQGFRVGMVSNGYWATDLDTALECLRPFKDLVEDLSISNDEYHGGATRLGQAQYAREAAEQLGIPSAFIRIAAPETMSALRVVGQIPSGASSVRFRGRAAERLSGRAEQHPWEEFTECTCEDLREPGRIHIDPFGNVHLCQGVIVGNVFERPLKDICEAFDPDGHPIVGPLLRGGPAQLVRDFDLPHAERNADACHLCCEARNALRRRFQEILGPDQMYGLYDV